MLIDNRQILKRKNTVLFERLEKIDNQIVQDIEILPSKKGGNTLTVHLNDKIIYFHSKYDPVKEAATFISQFNDLKEYEHILFIGTGIGYHIQQILADNTHLTFSIYEPNIHILKNYLEVQNLNSFKEKRIEQIFNKISDIRDIDKFISRYTRKSLIIIWPVTQQLFADQIEEFKKIMVKLLKKERINISIDSKFQERWVINSLMNFPIIASTPNILLGANKNYFEGKPVLIVSAGPSLSLDIDYIRKIKEEGRAYIFAVGSAVKALIANSIVPDAFCSYDPSVNNYTVAEDIKINNLEIPIIFGSSIGHETLNEYPGKMIHFITSQDNLSKHFINPDEVILDSPSIAVMTLQILVKLKASPIILAGQNLSYHNNNRYAQEIKYEHISNELNEKEIKNQLYVKSVDGSNVPTNETFLLMKTSMEFIIGLSENSKVINTTKYGADIQGTSYIPIEQVMENVLVKKNIVNANWLNLNNTYNLITLYNRFKELEIEYKKFKKIINEIFSIIIDFQAIEKKNIYSNIQPLFEKFDLLYEKLKENLFFILIITPMIKVQYKVYRNRVNEVIICTNPSKKVFLFNAIQGKYIKSIMAALKMIEPIFEKVSNKINQDCLEFEKEI